MRVSRRVNEDGTGARCLWRRLRGGPLLRYVGRRRLFNVALAAVACCGVAIALAAAGTKPIAAGAAEPVRILALGDSLTAGYGLATQEAFPARLEAALVARGLPAEVIDAGVSGDTTAGGLARLDWALASARPVLAIVELGANDGLRGLSPRQTRANLERIVRRLKSLGIKVLLAGMYAPPNLGREYGREFDSIYRELADDNGVALYPFFLEGVAARPDLLQPDGLHPNSSGVEEIVRRIAPAVERLAREG